MIEIVTAFKLAGHIIPLVDQGHFPAAYLSALSFITRQRGLREDAEIKKATAKATARQKAKGFRH